jgi:hypothetical protein
VQALGELALLARGPFAVAPVASLEQAAEDLATAERDAREALAGASAVGEV